MPVTIPLFLAVLVALGLQPSYLLQLTLYITFTSLVLFFTILGMYKLTSIDDEISIPIKLNKFEEIPSGIIFFMHVFIILSHGPSGRNGMNLPSLLLLLSVIGILTALNEKHKCDSIISCLKIVGSWTELITLALTISSIGLCLPDLFVVVQNYIYETSGLKKMMIITKKRWNISILIGVTCAGMVYFCSISTLVMLSGSSVVLVSTIEKLIILLNIPMNDDKSVDASCNTADIENGDNSKDEDSSLEPSDSESTCSDISLIVAEYKAKIKIMEGETDSTESKLKRMLFIYRGLIVMITVLGLILAYSIQYLQLVMATITALGSMIILILQQWITSHVKILDDPQNSELKMVLSYLFCVILLGGIPKQVWLCIVIWSAKGAIIHIIQKNSHTFYERIQTKHILSINQSPPTFETTCDSFVQRKNQLNN